MSNPNQNLKKFIVEKFVDIVEIVGFLLVFFFLTNFAFNYGDLAGGGAIIGILIIFWVVSRYTSRVFVKWTTPILEREEKRKFLLADTLYTIILLGLIGYFLWSYVNNYLLVVLFVLLLAIQEYLKWRQFKKEYDEIEEAIQEGIAKSIEKTQEPKDEIPEIESIEVIKPEEIKPIKEGGVVEDESRHE